MSTESNNLIITTHQSLHNTRIIAVRNGENVGVLELRARTPMTWAAYRTFVDPAARGEGLAGKLYKEMVSWATQHEFKIIPECSYIVKKFEAPDTPKEIMA